MNRRNRWTGWLCAALLVGLSLAGAAQATTSVQAPGLSLLLVDGTKTFASTARSGALAAAVRSTGLFDLSVRFSDRTHPFDDPLAEEADLPEEPYDVIVIIPRGIDDGSADAIWIVTNILPWASPAGWPAVAALQEMINQVFAGLATGVNPSADLWPAFAASLYRVQGWVR